MQIKIQDGVVDLSGETILKRINIEINTQSKIGIVGRNGICRRLRRGCANGTQRGADLRRRGLGVPRRRRITPRRRGNIAPNPDGLVTLFIILKAKCHFFVDIFS